MRLSVRRQDAPSSTPIGRSIDLVSRRRAVQSSVFHRRHDDATPNGFSRVFATKTARLAGELAAGQRAAQNLLCGEWSSRWGDNELSLNAGGRPANEQRIQTRSHHFSYRRHHSWFRLLLAGAALPLSVCLETPLGPLDSGPALAPEPHARARGLNIRHLRVN